MRSLAEVEGIREQYAKAADLGVVGLNLDADQEKAQRLIKEPKLTWRHAYLGDWAQTDIPKRFAVSALPAYALIGPEGKL